MSAILKIHVAETHQVGRPHNQETIDRHKEGIFQSTGLLFRFIRHAGIFEMFQEHCRLYM